MPHFRSRRPSAALLGLAASMAGFFQPAAHACAVCFGRTDSPLGKGLHWGVLALLAFIVLMLAAFGTFAVYLARRSVAMESPEFRETDTSPATSTDSRPTSAS